MKPKTKQEVIDQAIRISEKGCVGILCDDCIFSGEQHLCVSLKSTAEAFLAGARFEEDNTAKKTKCYECKHGNKEKTQPPCSACSGRPHDLYCEDRFDPSSEKFKPCPQCKNPRGENEYGAYIVPCPHCGDKLPF